MLDKVVILSCRKQAYIVFEDRTIGLFHDINVIPLVMWFFSDKPVNIPVNSDPDEITMEIVLDKAS